MYRPTWVEIDRTAFTNNVKTVSSCLKSGTRILAVVKANAYGHMAAPLSRLAVKSGASSLGVSSIEEGIALRESGITCPILILGSIYPLENLAVAREHTLIPTISSLQGLLDLVRLGRKTGAPLPFHLKIDTGMCRIGISAGTAPSVLEKIACHKEVAMTGMYMHFAAADADPRFTRMQREKFTDVVRFARKLGLKFAAHAANSAALLKGREYHFDLVRPGISLYGLLPFDGAEKKAFLEPVLAWKTRIVFLKKVPKGTPVSYGGTYVTRRQSLIATLPVGYADGFNRSLSNRAEVLIRGRRCPVVGRVTMDMIMADVTAVRGVAIGDEAVLIGAQGTERIRAEEVARHAGTINYEITCAISSRVPRILV
ncbi:MAG: alanine racemase [Endomicrobiales bacterium]